MGTTVSTISRKITIKYIETTKIILRNNVTLMPLILNVNKVDEFLNEETEWSNTNYEEFDVIYDEFLLWIKKKYNVFHYNKKIFFEKLKSKRMIENNIVKNIRLINSINIDNLRI